MVTQDDDELCCICEEKRSDIMLQCYHLFCEKCIETWLFKKINSCPLCRVRVSITNKENKNGNNNDDSSKQKNYWNVIEKTQIDQKEYFEEMKNRMFNAISTLNTNK